MPKRPLAPRFINKLDDYLLRNKPDTWTTRVHLVLYYTLMYALGLAVLCFVVPDNPLRDSYYGYWMAAQSCMVIVAIVVWIVYLVRFNTFKSFGLTHGGDRIKNYFLFFFTLCTLIGTIYIQPVVESYKAMIHYSPSSIVEDMDEMNILLARLTKEEYPVEVTAEKIVIVPGGGGYYNYTYPSYTDAYQWIDSLNMYVKPTAYMTREELQWNISDEDSVQWFGTDTLIRYHVTSLQFISNYHVDGSEKGEMKQMSSFDIYNRVYKGGASGDDLQKLKKDFFDLSQKYRDPYNEDDYGYWSYSTDPYSIVITTYKVGQVTSGISNIFSRYYRWRDEEILIMIHVIYYISMFLGLCLYIFRHSTIRTFFLSVLTGLMLFIISGVIGVFFEIEPEGAIILGFVYYLFFLIFSLTTVNWKVRSVFTGISLNLLVICTPFVPLAIVGLYDQLNPYYYDYPYYYSLGIYNYYDDSARDTLQMWYYLSEIFGFVILLILTETVFKWMYRKWYAAPEE
jgi:hypothetical protein